MNAIDVPDDLAGLDAALEQVANQPAVFLLWPRAGEPYLARTALLRRRLLRLLKAREGASRLLNLRLTVRRIEYAFTASRLESAVRMYELARRHFPRDYPERLKLRLPPYVKITLENEFPRSTVTTRLARGAAVYFGPFHARAAAERFESGMLDLFQMRRCQEELAPSPDHPGCIYGEMGMCLRPCQQVVGADEYRHEVNRVTEFLSTRGHSLLDSIARSRDRLSEAMEFEEAARQHRRYEKVREVVGEADALAGDIDRMDGVAVTAALAPQAVTLWFVRGGLLYPPREFSFEVQEGRPASLDQRLREVTGALDEPRRVSHRERQERLALFARWFYSSWRDGEWIPFEDFAHIPYRKLVHAISRVAKEGTTVG